MEKCLINESVDVRAAILAIELGQKGIAVVIDASGCLQGVVTDGDVRRGLLAGLKLDEPITTIMNRKPTKAESKMSQSSIIELLQQGELEALPLVDSNNCVVDVILLTDLTQRIDTEKADGFSCALIMAGGEGRRLLPLTENLPKPLVEVGGMPLIERQVRRVANAGMDKVYIAVNYLAEMIESHLGDGSQFGVEIQYLHEQQKLGTAGAISLIQETLDGPLLLMNGDVFTSINFRYLLDFHYTHQPFMTVAAIDYHIEIPYGVIKTEGAYAQYLEEKPSQHFLCNAGIYAISPEAVCRVPKNCPYNMTDLIELSISENSGVVVFPVHEYWSDIGTHDELNKARTELKIVKETLGDLEEFDEAAVNIELNHRRAA